MIDRFLAALHTLTFSQAPVERYLSCLDIWADLAERKNEGCRDYLRLYEYYFIVVVEKILCRIQYRFNWEELADIDRDSVDDDGQTQWDYYLSRCVEVIARVGELFPDDTLAQVAEAWSKCAETFLRGNSMLRTSEVSSEERDLRRDLASLTLAVGRTASFGALSRPPMANDHSSKLESRALELVTKLVTLASTGVQRNPVPSADLIEVHAQNLAALQAWCHWMAQRMGPSGELPATELVSRSAECAANAILAGAEWSAGRFGVGKAARVPHAAAHLFCTLTAVARLPRLWQNPNVSPLFSRGRDVLLALPEETGHLVARGLQNALLLGQAGEGSTPEAAWNERETLYASLLSSLVDQESLDTLGNVPGQCSDFARVSVAVRAWRLIADQLENGRGMGGRSKRALHACLVPHLNLALRLLPHLTVHPGMRSSSVVDHNTFARALARLGEDLRCHRLCNAISPGHGIHLSMAFSTNRRLSLSYGGGNQRNTEVKRMPVSSPRPLSLTFELEGPKSHEGQDSPTRGTTFTDGLILASSSVFILFFGGV
ncbi:hypothetical protein J437_LFUL007682 [Ladona fulva]|uniref:Uncharacterized protein n=1 Tax=Ladona fulva TaxID=123851 RepID=A0A8K0P0F8_LADFU|nr:hypothetical protein J437_LFUL007682 [Ladona fulva]